jgi:hypothetical protein
VQNALYLQSQESICYAWGRHIHNIRKRVDNFSSILLDLSLQMFKWDNRERYRKEAKEREIKTL